jgi:uncharacterized protein
MTDNPSLMEFPCDFPIKIIGENSTTFLTSITNVVHQHFPEQLTHSICSQPSKQGNYLAITATVKAHDQKSLDALYLDLTKHPGIKMVL